LTLKSQRHPGDILGMEIVMTKCRSLVLGSLAASACLALVACSSTPPVSDTTVTVSATVGAGFDTTSVMPGEDVPVVATAQNVYLVDPASEPSAAHVGDAGHFQVYLDDDTTSTALLVTAETTFNVTIPSDAKAGAHTVICRVYKHDGTPTSAHANLTINVKTTTGGGTTCTTNSSTGDMTCTTGNTTCVSTTSGTTTCTTGNTTCTMPTGSTPTGNSTCTTQGTTTTCITGSTTCITTGA
jgi:hypothetical protein